MKINEDDIREALHTVLMEESIQYFLTEAYGISQEVRKMVSFLQGYVKKSKPLCESSITVLSPLDGQPLTIDFLSLKTYVNLYGDDSDGLYIRELRKIVLILDYVNSETGMDYIHRVVIHEFTHHVQYNCVTQPTAKPKRLRYQKDSDKTITDPIAKDILYYFNPEETSAMVSETDFYFKKIISSGKYSYQDLLTTPHAFVEKTFEVPLRLKQMKKCIEIVSNTESTLKNTNFLFQVAKSINNSTFDRSEKRKNEIIKYYNLILKHNNPKEVFGEYIAKINSEIEILKTMCLKNMNDVYNAYRKKIFEVWDRLVYEWIENNGSWKLTIEK